MGQDAFTILLSLGMTILSVLRAGSTPKGRLVVVGGLASLGYIYGWFSFGLVWSPLFPLYLLLFGGAVFLAAAELVALARGGTLSAADPGFPRRTAAIVSILSVVGVGASEILILSKKGLQ